MPSAGLHSIDVALTREEWQCFRAVAELRRMTLSDLMREALRLAPIADAQGRAVAARRTAEERSRARARPEIGAARW